MSYCVYACMYLCVHACMFICQYVAKAMYIMNVYEFFYPYLTRKQKFLPVPITFCYPFLPVPTGIPVTRRYRVVANEGQRYQK